MFPIKQQLISISSRKERRMLCRFTLHYTSPGPKPKNSIQKPRNTNQIPFYKSPKSNQNNKIHKPLTMVKPKQYWLLKTEPSEWSWSDQEANAGITKWDGVKNKQAQKYLKSMTLGDLCFFYHSGNKARSIVGVVEVTREWYYSDEENGEDGAVDVKCVGEMRKFVDLKEMKGEKGIKDFVLFRQPRLSVVPVDENVWKKICELGSGFQGDGMEDLGSDEC